jgi:hypothetical protein
MDQTIAEMTAMATASKIAKGRLLSRRTPAP